MLMQEALHSDGAQRDLKGEGRRAEGRRVEGGLRGRGGGRQAGVYVIPDMQTTSHTVTAWSHPEAVTATVASVPGHTFHVIIRDSVCVHCCMQATSHTVTGWSHPPPVARSLVTLYMCVIRTRQDCTGLYHQQGQRVWAVV